MNARPPSERMVADARRRWEALREGQELPVLGFPLSVCRLVVAAGANRDFNSIHHNSELAKATGAPEMYANYMFLMGMWERAVRDCIGLAGRIHRISGFRMKSFNTVGDTVVVKARIVRKWVEGGRGFVEFDLRSENASGVSVGPGRVIASVPLAADVHPDHRLPAP